MELLVLFVGLLVLDVAALLWGADSRDGLGDAEWSRRKSWRGFEA